MNFGLFEQSSGKTAQGRKYSNQDNIINNLKISPKSKEEKTN